MGLNSINYALSNRYTDDSVLGISGALAGKNCTIEKIDYASGTHTVHFLWTADDGTQRRESMVVDDGDNIYSFYPNTEYDVDDIIIYEGSLYRCTVKHISGQTLDTSKFDAIISADGNYSLHDNYGDLNQQLKPADRKMAYCINDYTAPNNIVYRKGYYVWDGTKWERTTPPVLDRFAEIELADGTHELYFDGQKVITEPAVGYILVDTYVDIDTTRNINTMYFVQNATLNAGVIEHYSGNYFFDALSGVITYMDERESDDIDFTGGDYIPVIG